MASRSLGQLTIDLIAKIGGFTQGMTEAERVADKKSRDIQKKLEARAKEIEAAWTKMTIGLAAGMTGIGMMVRSVVSEAKEISNLAAISNATTTEFQRMAAAASVVGVNQDKLGDQLKDFSEKVGEFQRTGAGGMKDFFEQVAPKVGVTAEAFRNLSGPQALQLYYDSLQKAGLSQEQMSFYMESMASDTTALLPLLADGGALMKELGDAAEATGAIMDTKTIRAAQEMQLAMDVLSNQTKGLRNELVGAMLPTLVDLSGGLAEVSVETGIAAEAGETFAAALKGVVATTVGAYSAIQLLGKGMGGLGAIIAADWDQKGAVASMVLEDLQANALKYGETINKVWDAGSQGGGSDWNQRIKSWADARERAMAAMRTGTSSVTPPTKSTGGKTQAEKDAAAAERFVQSLRDQVARKQNLTHFEQLHYDIQSKGLKLSADQLGVAEGMATALDMSVEAERQRKEEIQQQNLLYEMQERLMSKQQQYELTLATYGMGDGAASEMQERVRLMQEQQAELRKLAQDQTQAMAQAETEAARAQVESAYAARREALAQAHSIELQDFEQFLMQKKEREANWALGAQSAFQTYAEQAGNTYEQVKGVAGRALQGMEDNLVSFITTGKGDFKGLANSIVADITRIIIKEQMSKLFSGLLGLGGSGGDSGGGLLGSIFGMFTANAKGGVYDSPSLNQYSNQVHTTPKLFAFAKGAGVFAEAGPEAIMPLARGPNGNLGVRVHGGGEQNQKPAQVLTVNVQMPQGASRETAMQFGQAAGRQMQIALRRNG